MNKEMHISWQNPTSSRLVSITFERGVRVLERLIHHYPEPSKITGRWLDPTQEYTVPDRGTAHLKIILPNNTSDEVIVRDFGSCDRPGDGHHAGAGITVKECTNGKNELPKATLTPEYPCVILAGAAEFTWMKEKEPLPV